MCGAFTNTAKLLDFFKSGSVMPTEAIASLGIPYDGRNHVGVQHHWIHSLVVMEIPLEFVALEVKVSRLFEDELNRKVHLVE